MLDPNRLEKIIYEARARVTWGEDGESIAEWMTLEGVEPNLVHEVLAAAFKERDADVRRMGFSESIIGGLIIAGCAAAMWLLLSIGFMESRIFGGIVLAGGYGIYRLANGLIWLSFGKNVSGSVGDLN